ncbi:AAA family ATPase [Thiothrix subterranea]|uniref:AAA family ATPase n=1 Tax=Thiothrix subterranea TaxID=2735563 RepID=A0AA51MLE1_9GAMM|nr:AAA family ATPase [Thiothrix subterranea]MDQ5770287.1 AAA family ATPase [Thiothrix subterranea]WML85829.1 AAA family ATPase [Thiothrix subterranea]
MLDSLHIKNFRCFEDLTIPSLGRVNLIVGKNNSGKSTLLEAISVFAQHGSYKALNEIALMRNESLSTHTIMDIFSGKDSYIGDSSKKNYIQYHFNSEHGRIETDAIKNGERIATLSREGKNLLTENFTLAPDNYPSSLVRTIIYSDKELSEAWDQIRIQKQEKLITNALKIIDSNIENVFYTTKQNTMVSVLGEKEARPIKSMGEGMSRLLQIFLHAYQAKGGYLMIDEFENGLHYSIQEEIWEKLFKLAKELDIQVFATTHSEDAVKAFCKVSVADKEVNGKLISLGRSISKSDNGKIIADVYDEDTLNWLTTSGMEVR